MKIHLIAIGGSAMHNLAIALKEKGYIVTGSDDEIFEPSRTRLEKHGLLPKEMGWFPGKITPDLDAVILGMHATEDNPELEKARKMGHTIFSYPEYLYEQTKNKKRIIIAGSHGKTTITSMIMHVLNHYNRNFDYMVGAQVEGFDTMVRLSESAPVAIFEGDEYLASPLDKRPKFHLYHPHIAVISGIAWDHVNVFPTFENYQDQFVSFINMMEHNGQLFYYEGDSILKGVVDKATNNVCKTPYGVHPHQINNHQTYLLTQSGGYKLNIFGSHNLQNVSAAKLICNLLEVSDVEFYKAIATFRGAAKRLQQVKSGTESTVYLDFAHAPSKVKATVSALKKQYPERKLIACLELHTFSSLTAEFLKHYNSTMQEADAALVYYNPETLKHKRLPYVAPEKVKESFGSGNIDIFTDTQTLVSRVKSLKERNANYLFMSSGNFGGLDIHSFAKELV